VLRKKLAVLMTVAMMAVLVASPAWAAPGGNLKGARPCWHTGGTFVNLFRAEAHGRPDLRQG
jgi:hypothetical protein